MMLKSMEGGKVKKGRNREGEIADRESGWFGEKNRFLRKWKYVNTLKWSSLFIEGNSKIIPRDFQRTPNASARKAEGRALGERFGSRRCRVLATRSAGAGDD